MFHTYTDLFCCLQWNDAAGVWKIVYLLNLITLTLRPPKYIKPLYCVLYCLYINGHKKLLWKFRERYRPQNVLYRLILSGSNDWKKEGNIKGT